MAGGVFVLKDGGKLVAMNEVAYDSEALLQKLLATFPDLLGGDQVDPGNPRRWLLIDRKEQRIPLRARVGTHGM